MRIDPSTRAWRFGLVAAWVGLGVAGAARDASGAMQYGPVAPMAAPGPIERVGEGSPVAGPGPSMDERRLGEGDGSVGASVRAFEARALGGVAAAPADATDVAAGVEGASPLGPTLVTLAGVVALMVIVLGCVRLGRGRGAVLSGHRAPSGLLEVLGRYPMAGGVTLVLLRADRRVLLLSQARASRLGGAALSTLAEFGDVDEVASILAQARDARDESISARFASLLGAFSAEHAGVGASDRAVRGDRDEPVDARWEEAGGSEDGQGPSSRLRRRLEGVRVWEGVTA